jgi:hypothetical protein
MPAVDETDMKHIQRRPDMIVQGITTLKGPTLSENYCTQKSANYNHQMQLLVRREGHKKHTKLGTIRPKTLVLFMTARR